MPRVRLYVGMGIVALIATTMEASLGQSPVAQTQEVQGRSVPVPVMGGIGSDSSRGVAKWSTTRFPGRLIFLNGVNIGSVRNQRLHNVEVFIDEHGNVHFTAQHYDVREQSSYHPLLPNEIPQYSKGLGAPQFTQPVQPEASPPFDSEPKSGDYLPESAVQDSPPPLPAPEPAAQP